ncbi:MAG TPA: PEP-CTERM sorting domain-containing protein [Tepidisphaeraceae bacterium]|nr:PEP-CTERM sorting domain-containing protein [Tepidisphaeraceae bacterium]
MGLIGSNYYLNFLDDGFFILTLLLWQVHCQERTGTAHGPGIDNSSAAANHNYAVGYADSADPSNPAGLSSNQIEIKYTLYGDTNLDGTVNSIDFGLLAANFGKSASGTTVALPSIDWAALDAFAAANGLMADVPEPTFLCLSMLVGFGILARRRK